MSKTTDLARRIVHGVYGNRWLRRSVIDRFHRLYYYGSRASRPWHQTQWLGHTVLKCPFDLWVYQELVFRIRPEVIVECGTGDGGSALYLASMCRLLEMGEVISIDDRNQDDRPEHPRITYIGGSSTADETLATVRSRIGERSPVLVILDSDHARDHVLDECRAYGPLVTPGSYLIVEDTNINGHPVSPHFGPGPGEAVDAFLEECSDFERDPECERHLLTFNPGGFLRKSLSKAR